MSGNRNSLRFWVFPWDSSRCFMELVRAVNCDITFTFTHALQVFVLAIKMCPNGGHSNFDNCQTVVTLSVHSCMTV